MLTAIADTRIGTYPKDFRESVRGVIDPYRKAMEEFTGFHPVAITEIHFDSLQPLARDWSSFWTIWQEEHEGSIRKEL